MTTRHLPSGRAPRPGARPDGASDGTMPEAAQLRQSCEHRPPVTTTRAMPPLLQTRTLPAAATPSNPGNATPGYPLNRTGNCSWILAVRHGRSAAGRSRLGGCPVPPSARFARRGFLLASISTYRTGSWPAASCRSREPEPRHGVTPPLPLPRRGVPSLGEIGRLGDHLRGRRILIQAGQRVPELLCAQRPSAVITGLPGSPATAPNPLRNVTRRACSCRHLIPGSDDRVRRHVLQPDSRGKPTLISWSREEDPRGPDE